MGEMLGRTTTSPAFSTAHLQTGRALTTLPNGGDLAFNRTLSSKITCEVTCAEQLQFTLPYGGNLAFNRTLRSIITCEVTRAEQLQFTLPNGGDLAFNRTLSSVKTCEEHVQNNAIHAS